MPRFKHPDAIKPSLLLLSYLMLAYPLALYGMSSPLWFVPSLLLLANVLVLCAYLLHDCLHNNVFASPVDNERLGTLLAWMVGAVYSPCAALRDKHFRHHIERADILAVNYQQVLLRHPVLDRCVKWAAYAYLPAVDVLLQWLEVPAPFHLPQRRHLRRRTLCILGVRISVFGALYWLNLLVLNFCYHNAHHQKPSEPWYRLPVLHEKLYAGGCPQHVPLATQLAHFHRYRLDRIHHADSDRPTGADGVSFLVGV